jgi:hypothetical protein
MERGPNGTQIIITPGVGSGGSKSSWKGEWSSTDSYEEGAIVRVTSNPLNGEGDPIEGDGNNYTGVWLAVQASLNQRPIYPEPETVYWVLIALGPREIDVADVVSGSKKMLVAGNDPYAAP